MALKKYFPIFVLPTLVAFTIAFAVPFILGLYLSFTEFTTVADAQWVGILNYIRAFSNDDFLNALWFTVKCTVVSVITVNLIAFALASILTKGLKGTNIFRTVFFMPNLIGGIVLGYIWQLIINGVLQTMG
ncbi:MAG: sugar ABC transporter permease, partial [Acutalibacteraceae bacterium]|nr:sugar ABC transporter permease [Acutalibacteraceae bacterium]